MATPETTRIIIELEIAADADPDEVMETVDRLLDEGGFQDAINDEFEGDPIVLNATAAFGEDDDEDDEED